MKRFSVLVLLSILIFALAGCSFLAKPGTVQGTVTDVLSGLGIADATVTLGNATTKTTADGSFTISIKPGVYSLAVSKAGYDEFTKDKITVESEKTVTEDVQLTPATTGQVYGTLTNSLTNAPVAGATVTIGTLTATTDENGNYQINNVLPGSKTVSFEAEGYNAANMTVTVVVSEKVAADAELDPFGYIEGYVTDTRGGPVLPGVSVKYADYTATTDENGYFSIKVDGGIVADVMFEKAGMASARVQNVSIVDGGQVNTYEIPLRAVFNPSWSTVPPTISFQGITAGQVITADTPVSVKFNAPLGVAVGYIYLGSEGRVPTTPVYGNTTYTVKPLSQQNGPSYIKVMVFDNNENLAMAYLPIVIKNIDSVPGEIPYVEASSITFGQTFGYYSVNSTASADVKTVQLPNGREVNTQSFSESATILNRIWWDGAPGATSYNVYRSFDNVNFEKISSTNARYEYKPNVVMYRFDDYSPMLAPNKKTYYKIVPFNVFGESTTESTFDLTPLPTYNVNLVSPANGDEGVSTTPTFTWERLYTGPTQGVYFVDFFLLDDSTNYRMVDQYTINQTSLVSPVTLEPGNVYNWDIYDGYATIDYVDTENQYTYAIAFLNGQAGGSLNGKNEFTTTYSVGQ